MKSFLRNLFNKRNIHLDFASTTPISPEVLRAMRPYWSERFYNPSSSYLDAQNVKKEIKKCRIETARLLQCRESEVVYTQGGTESVNLAILGVARHALAHCDFVPHMIFSAIEHPAVSECVPVLEKMGVEVSVVGVSEKGIVDVQALEKLITERTVLVSVIMVSNEIGVIQPIHKVASILKKYKNRVGRTFSQYPFLHTDASQAVVTEEVGANKLGADLISVDGSKIYAPKMTGILMRKQHVALEPLVYGGGQEYGLRSGTENAAGIIAISTALRVAKERREEDVARFARLNATFREEISKLPYAYYIQSAQDSCVPHIVNICVEGLNSDFAVVQMDELGVNCSAMTACASAKGVPKSQVIEAIGRPQCAASSLRFSFGRDTTRSEVKKAVGLLEIACRKQRLS